MRASRVWWAWPLFSPELRARCWSSVFFAFEITLHPLGLLPLLGGCTAAYLVSCLLMENTIMTEKIVRRGVRVPSEYAADYLDQISVRNAASSPVVTLNATDTLREVRTWFHSGAVEAHHQGYPVLERVMDLD